MIPTNVIHLKQPQKNEFGMEEIIYATESQVSKIVTMRNDPDKRYNFVKIDRFIFSPMDVRLIETRHKNKYELPKYFLERYNSEKTGVVVIK